MPINEYDIVALTENISATHPETNQPFLLRRGQVGTVLTNLNNKAYLIDFADREGHTYAMETIPPTKLMLLFHEPVTVAV